MQLEHCPFCGTTHSLMPDASGRHQQIVCGACGARGPEVYRFLPYVVAAESWNVRQGPREVNETHRPSGVPVAEKALRHVQEVFRQNAPDIGVKGPEHG